MEKDAAISCKFNHGTNCILGCPSEHVGAMAACPYGIGGTEASGNKCRCYKSNTSDAAPGVQMHLEMKAKIKDSLPSKDGFENKRSFETELESARSRRKSLIGSRNPEDIREIKDLDQYIRQLEKEIRNWDSKDVEGAKCDVCGQGPASEYGGSMLCVVHKAAFKEQALTRKS